MSEPFDQADETQILESLSDLQIDRVQDAHVVKAVETIHREYNVTADDPAQAADRLRRYFADPDMVAPGVVVRVNEGERVRWRIPSERTDAG